MRALIYCMTLLFLSSGSLFLWQQVSTKVRSPLELQRLAGEAWGREWYKDAIADAKSEGRSEIIIPGAMESQRTTPLTLDDVKDRCSILRVRVTAKETFVSQGAQDIVTWYKLAVVETLQAQQRIDPKPLHENDVPANLLPLDASECLFPVLTGTVIIDGVRLVRASQRGQIPVDVGSEYVIVAFLENQNKILIAADSAAGFFAVAPDLSLRPLSEPNRGLTQELLSRNVNTVEMLRAEISSRQKPLR